MNGRKLFSSYFQIENLDGKIDFEQSIRITPMHKEITAQPLLD